VCKFLPRQTCLNGLMALAALLCLVAMQGADVRAQTAQLAYSPRGEPMTFSMADGDGPLGARRWVAASGQIQRDTASKFIAFKASNPVEGLFLALDSNGGSVGAAMALGQMVRAARMQTIVGRTVTVGEKQRLRSAETSCASSCVLVLMGGIRRHVPEDASVEVHMFSVNLNAEGEKIRPDITMRDVEDAQRAMARHAVYVNEMGINPRYLELMTEASFKGAIRRLTPKEMTGIQLAEPAGKQVAPVTAAAWALTSPSSPPQLLRAMRLLGNERQIIDHELVVSCDNVTGFYGVLYRQTLTRAVQPAQQLSLVRARLETGGWDYIFRPPQRPLVTNKEGGDVWMRRSVPRKVFEDAVANQKLLVEVTATVVKSEPSNFYEPGLAMALPQLARRCDERPGQVPVGPHPRR
jgi:hypothetical protein